VKKLVSIAFALIVVASLLAACGATPEPEVVEVIVTQEVEKTVVETVVETVEVEVEKTVIETVEVEVEKEVQVEVTAVPEPVEEPRTIRVVKMEPNVGLDPGTSSTALSLSVMGLMHDVLWEYDENWDPIPWVAESWESNEDATEWTFQLRDGMAFSDGSPITSEDVAFSLEYLKERPVWSGRLAPVEAVETPDESTVVIKMSRPVPEFLQLPADQLGLWIVSKAACSGGKCGSFTVPGTVTSGPFMLEEYVLKDHMTLVRNPYYGIEGLPKMDRVYFTWTGDRAAAVAAIEAGQADFTVPVNAPDAALLVDNPNVSFYVGPRIDQYRGWAFDGSMPPFNDKRVRQALGYAVESEEIVDTCWYGFSSPLWGGYFYEKDPWFEQLGHTPWKDKSREERLAIADELLTEAGWEDKDGDGVRESYGIEGIEDGTPFAVEAVYEKPWVQSECHALLVQEYWKDIGLDLSILGLPKTNYWPDVLAGKFQMWHIGGGSSPIPWLKFATIWHPDGSRFGQMVREYGPESEAEKLRADIDAIVAEQDIDKKTEMMIEFSDYLTDQQFFVATGSQDSLYAGNGNMEGFYGLWNTSMRPLIWADIPEE
jgi:peptide/nickel transport system substrate-binding protein